MFVIYERIIIAAKTLLISNRSRQKIVNIAETYSEHSRTSKMDLSDGATSC